MWRMKLLWFSLLCTVSLKVWEVPATFQDGFDYMCCAIHGKFPFVADLLLLSPKNTSPSKDKQTTAEEKPSLSNKDHAAAMSGSLYGFWVLWKLLYCSVNFNHHRSSSRVGDPSQLIGISFQNHLGCKSSVRSLSPTFDLSLSATMVSWNLCPNLSFPFPV